MASRAVEIGAIGRHVAEAIARLRRERGLEQRELAERATAAGRYMTATVLSKIESCARRVDVDDLVAIATALEISPALLLLAAPAEPDSAAEARPSSAASVTSAVRSDIEALGDLAGLEPSLAALALRLAAEIDAGAVEGGPSLPALTRELRVTLAQLIAARGPGQDDDDELGDLGIPA